MTIAPRSSRPSMDGSVSKRLAGLRGATAMANRAGLMGFFALTFTWSWSLWLLSAAVHPASGALVVVLSVAASFGPSLAAAVVVFFSAGPGELRRWLKRCLRWRVGWRWQTRFGWRVASLLMGALWGFWHLPLSFLVGTSQSQTPAVVFLAMIVALSVLFAWLFNRTGHSVVPALVLHTAFNAWAFLIPTLPSDKAQRPSEVVVGVFVLIALGLLLSPDRASAWRVR